MDDPTRAGGIVLCGGASSRMGTAKALLPFGDETMLQRTVRLLAMVVEPVVVAAAPGQTLPTLPSSTLIARDGVAGEGPLEGLRVAFETLPPETTHAYVTGCDAPLIQPAFVAKMLELSQEYDIVVVDVDGRLHPLSAVYRRTVLPYIDALLGARQRRLTSLLDAVSTRRVHAQEVASADPELLTLRNVNTPAEYRDALSRAGLT